MRRTINLPVRPIKFKVFFHPRLCLNHFSFIKTTLVTKTASSVILWMTRKFPSLLSLLVLGNRGNYRIHPIQVLLKQTQMKIVHHLENFGSICQFA